MSRIVLALDSTHDACSVAVVRDDGEVLAFELSEMERGQAEALMPMVKEAMDQAKCEFSDLSYVAVTVGPGSFTGVRVGLAAARGLALAAKLPMAGVNVCEAAAFDFYKKFPNDDRLLGVVLETKRDDFYVQFYKDGAPLSEPYTAFSSELKEKTDAVFIGNGTLRLKEEIPEACIEEMPMPTARTAAFLSFDKVASETYPTPLYLREAEVTLCRK